MSEGGSSTTGAVSIEARLSGVTKKYTENKGHFALVSFEVLATDLESSQGIWAAPLGSRFALALVEIDVDENPLERPKAKTKRKFRELPPANQAGIRCDEGAFQAFLEECYPKAWKICGSIEDATMEEVAAGVVRMVCEVDSRSGLLPDTEAAIIWGEINNHFVAWMEAG